MPAGHANTKPATAKVGGSKLSEPGPSEPGPRHGGHIQVSFTVTILTAFAALFLAVMGVVIVVAVGESRRAALEAAESAMANLAARTAAQVRAEVDPLIAVAAVAGDVGRTDGPTSDGPALLRMLAALPQARAATLIAPAGDPLLAVAGEGDAPPRLVPWADGDPRTSIEWRTAVNAEGATTTTVVHRLPSVGHNGVSIVRRLESGEVIVLDLTLDELDAFLAGARASPRSVAFLMDDYGTVLAHSLPGHATSGTDGTGTWIALNASRDPRDRAFWRSYATGGIRPDRNTLLDIDGEAWLARIAPVAGPATAPVVVGVMAPMDDFNAPIRRAEDNVLRLSIIAALVGLAAMWATATRITRPLEALTQEADAIGHFHLDRPLKVFSHITEVDRLAGTMRGMKSALQTFGQYVPKDLVRQLVLAERTARLGGARREVSVLFTDIVGFTTIADGIEPDTLMRITSAYFEHVTAELMAARGTIDKFIGDSVMALWNAPNSDPQHAAHACLAALRTRARSARLEEEFAARGWPRLPTRIGVNSGEAVVGNVGSSDRLSYTAIGTTVNMASRLEGLNRFYGTGILVTDDTRIAAGAGFVFRRIDCVRAKGRLAPTDIHELLGLSRATWAIDEPLVLPPAAIAAAADWDAMVAAYLARRFDDAAGMLGRLGLLVPEKLARLYATRIDLFTRTPPPPEWDGVVTFTEK